MRDGGEGGGDRACLAATGSTDGGGTVDSASGGGGTPSSTSSKWYSPSRSRCRHVALRGGVVVFAASAAVTPRNNT